MISRPEWMHDVSASEPIVVRRRGLPPATEEERRAYYSRPSLEASETILSWIFAGVAACCIGLGIVIGFVAAVGWFA